MVHLQSSQLNLPPAIFPVSTIWKPGRLCCQYVVFKYGLLSYLAQYYRGVFFTLLLLLLTKNNFSLAPPPNVTDSQRDGLYNYDPAVFKAANDAKPWKKDPNYFKTVRISAVALIKMVMHARSGGTLEVMGLMQGYVDGTALVVTDAFRPPCRGYRDPRQRPGGCQ